MTEKIGIIIIRHITDDENSMYWRYCVRAIRVNHPEVPIVIIDDNSNSTFLTDALKKEEAELYNCRIIYSIYKKQGEFLPYYYFSLSQNGWFENAMIIHDSVFFTRPLTNLDVVFDILGKQGFLFLWHFEYLYDDVADEVKLITALKNGNEVLETVYYDRSMWSGCFGSMAFVSYAFTAKMFESYALSNLLHEITTRRNRMSFERLIACAMIHAAIQDDKTKSQEKSYSYYKMHSYLGLIHDYCKWGLRFHEIKDEIIAACEEDKTSSSIQFPLINVLSARFPLIKVWSGR
jgi:hypothetical protein